jgi:LAS superfamily LD-carboxypeptidase LdcB
MKLRAIAHSKLNDMAQEFYQIFGDKLVIVSAYRSYEYQKKLKK